MLLFNSIALLMGGTIYLLQGPWHYDTREVYLYVFPLIVGISFYSIGCSMRVRTPERKLKCSTKVVSILILIISGILLLYVLWAKYRLHSTDFFLQPSQVWIHPDQMILWLNQYYDRMFPGGFKIEGELPRVEGTFILLIAPLVGIIGWRLGLLLPIKKKYVYRLLGLIKRYFLRK